MSDDSEVALGLVDELLALPTVEERAARLRAAGLLDAEGLDRLLDVADHLLGDDPGKARQLAELCAELAEEAVVPAAVPRANYIRAGAHNINGEFDEDLRLTRAAHDGYLALGMELEALRTNVGRMAALLELGRYVDALDAGRTVLEALDGGFEPPPTSEEVDLLTALVHQNRGGCLEYMGRYEEALDDYEVAEKLYRSLGVTERLGEVLGNRGAILLHLGRGSEALAVHEATADIFSETGLTLWYVKALSNIGEDHLQLANYMQSLDALEHAHRLLNSLNALTEECFVLRNIANAYLALNLFSEALAAYREADGLLRVTGLAHDRAQALWGMGAALVARAELGEAEDTLGEAAALFGKAGNLPLLSGVMLEQASLLAARGYRDSALAMARRALELVSEEGWPVQQVYARLRLADLLLPDAAAAEPHLLAVQRLAARLALPPQLRFRLDERLGHLRRLQGRDEEARTLLEAAIEELERLRGTVTQDAMRVSFLRDKTAAYEDLLQLYLARDDEANVRRAFTVAERAKSRALVDLLAGVTGKETLANPELERQFRELQADLNAVYSELLSGPGERKAPLPDLHGRATELEVEIGRVRLQAAAAGSQTELFATPASLGAIQSKLPPDVVLLAYHVVGDEILAFVYARDRISVARSLSTVPSVRRLLRKLAVQWDRLSAGSEFAGRHMVMLERSTRQVLAALYSELVAPLAPLLEEAVASSVPGGSGAVPKLAVVPHGPLHQVPFHALFDGERYLVERFEVSYAPSATVYALCQERDMRDPDEALVLGVEDPLIPAATTEARAVAQHFSEAHTRVGEEATVAALRSEAPGRGVLHLACHGLFRADNPMFSALKLHDGWLMAADVMGLDLKGALVTLSACESGRSEVVGGDEILGLTRAFLGAGAAALLVSLWLVQDETTAELMSKWYERLRNGEGRAAALRAAQLEVKEQHPHPYYWAPFVLVGKR